MENDLWNIIPGSPPVSTAVLTGRELLEMMEDNLERTFAADPYEQMGGYIKRCTGITVRAKLENPKGHRIESVFVEDEMLVPDASYSVAFVTAQGVLGKYGTDRKNLEIRAVDAFEGLRREARYCDTCTRGIDYRRLNQVMARHGSGTPASDRHRGLEGETPE